MNFAAKAQSEAPGISITAHRRRAGLVGVAIDLGTREGMEVGHVMRIFRAGEVVRDIVSEKRGETVKLPDEDAGLVMIFRTFEKVSFGLVMKATRAIHVLDYVRTT